MRLQQQASAFCEYFDFDLLPTSADEEYLPGYFMHF